MCEINWKSRFCSAFPGQCRGRRWNGTWSVKEKVGSKRVVPCSAPVGPVSQQEGAKGSGAQQWWQLFLPPVVLEEEVGFDNPDLLLYHWKQVGGGLANNWSSSSEVGWWGIQKSVGNRQSSTIPPSAQHNIFRTLVDELADSMYGTQYSSLENHRVGKSGRRIVV